MDFRGRVLDVQRTTGKKVPPPGFTLLGHRLQPLFPGWDEDSDLTSPLSCPQGWSLEAQH